MPTKIDQYRIGRKHDRRYRTDEGDAEAMRELYREGLTQKTIADIFGVSQSTVSYAVNDGAKERHAEYRKRNPPKKRTRTEARAYSKSLRTRKKLIIEMDRRGWDY